MVSSRSQDNSLSWVPSGRWVRHETLIGIRASLTGSVGHAKPASAGKPGERMVVRHVVCGAILKEVFPMYSMILLLAMGTSADAPAWGRHNCNGGCCGGGYACCGGGYGSCGGYYGGGGRHGCCGGGGYGCCGGYYGCCGGGGMGCCGGMMPGMAPRNAEMVPAPKGGAAPMTAGPAPATLLVHLPADATLTINTVPMTGSTADTRKFYSPPLQPGQDYSYVLQAQIARGGQTWVTNSRVIVRAGQETEVNLAIPGPALTQR